MPDWSSVACEEEAYSVREGYGSDGSFNASVTLRCAWASRHALVADFYTTMPTWYGGSIEAYPNGASIQPFGSETYGVSGQQIQYETALVTINFSSNAEQDLISESLEPTIESQILDHKRFRWSSGDVLLENEAPVRLVRGMNLVRTLYKQASIPALILTATGKVNNAAYTSALLGLTFPIETLLFTPPTMSRSITTSGSKGWDITLKFRYQQDGWNKFYRATTMAYEQIVVASTGAVYNNFPPISFAGLL